MRGYLARLTATAALIAILATPLLSSETEGNNQSIVPKCSTIETDPTVLNDIYFDRVVCKDDSLMGKLKQIEQMGNDLLPRLPAAWQPPFASQQSGFPGMGFGCTPDKMRECVSQAIDQRIQDLKDLSSYLGKQLPTCQSKDLSVKDSGYADAAMSQILAAYLIEYSGTEPCRLHGYPAVLLRDGKGEPKWKDVEYSGETYFSQIVGPPLPVTLTKDNSAVWFGLHSADACDPLPEGEHLTVDVALPHSQEWIGKIQLAYANCTPITVTPIAMISTMRSLIE